MATLTLRITRDCHDKIQQIAKETDQPLMSVIEDAVEEFRRQRLFDEADAAYRRLRGNRRAWKEELAERKLWEATLADGLEDE